jgi:hypothetical protein
MFDRLRDLPQDQFDVMAQRMASRAGEPGSAAYKQSLDFLSRVRGLSSTDYQQQRDQLTQQFTQQRIEATEGPEAAMDRFIDRYLLSFRTVPVLEEKLKR